MKKVKASDLMSKDLVSILPGSTVSEAAELMRKSNVGVLPVVSAGVLKGMVTDRDMILRCIAGGEDPRSTKAQDVMTTNIAYLSPEHSVQDVLHLMAAEQVHRVPVVEDGILQGLISMSDIARYCAENGGEDAMAKTVEEISETPRWQVYGDQKLREKREREARKS
ncbi:CBS domain-containing protein [Yeguia hominis]|uniref:CBS domain-containing protein n=1 Tax=Yeguia hominis TaxID=2763662 RepID=A0A926D790_9FIRM|nr:CBS domain-containing protein [Yeguia hominis]MBC8532659.1 CBS domain-containing protein [Yeguia hominis]